jgi:hypothetical protein
MSTLAELRRHIRTLEGGGPRQIELRRDYNRQRRLELQGGGAHDCDKAEPQTDEAKQLLLPNKHHFADHFIMVRQLPESNIKVATLNLASGAGSPFEFRNFELDELYTHIEDKYANGETVQFPPEFIEKMKAKFPSSDQIARIQVHYTGTSMQDIFGKRLAPGGKSRIFSGMDNTGPRPTILRTDASMVPVLKDALRLSSPNTAWIAAWFAAHANLEVKDFATLIDEGPTGFWRDDVPTEYSACTGHEVSHDIKPSAEQESDLRIAWMFWQFMGDYYQTKFVAEKCSGNRKISNHVIQILDTLLAAPEQPAAPEQIERWVKPDCINPKEMIEANQQANQHVVDIMEFCNNNNVHLICFSDFNHFVETALAKRTDWTQMGVAWPTEPKDRSKWGAAIYAKAGVVATSEEISGTRLKAGVKADVTLNSKQYTVYSMYMESDRKTQEDMGIMIDTKQFIRNSLSETVIIAGDFNTNTPDARKVMQNLGVANKDDEAYDPVTKRCSVYKWRSPLQWQLGKCDMDSAYKDWIIISDGKTKTKAHLLKSARNNKYVKGTQVNDQLLVTSNTDCDQALASATTAAKHEILRKKWKRGLEASAEQDSKLQTIRKHASHAMEETKAKQQAMLSEMESSKKKVQEAKESAEEEEEEAASGLTEFQSLAGLTKQLEKFEQRGKGFEWRVSNIKEEILELGKAGQKKEQTAQALDKATSNLAELQKRQDHYMSLAQLQETARTILNDLEGNEKSFQGTFKPTPEDLKAFVISLYNKEMQDLYQNIIPGIKGKEKEHSPALHVLYGASRKQSATCKSGPRFTKYYSCTIYGSETRFSKSLKPLYDNAVQSVKEDCPLFTYAPVAIVTLSNRSVEPVLSPQQLRNKLRNELFDKIKKGVEHRR